MAMDDAGKRRAADYLARQMARRGWSVATLAAHAELDPQTVRNFLNGETWPWVAKRTSMEKAAGLELGSLEMAARDMFPTPADADPVVQAIESSPLTRGQKAKLVGLYYDMLDEQQERGAG